MPHSVPLYRQEFPRTPISDRPVIPESESRPLQKPHQHWSEVSLALILEIKSLCARPLTLLRFVSPHHVRASGMAEWIPSSCLLRHKPLIRSAKSTRAAITRKNAAKTVCESDTQAKCHRGNDMKANCLRHRNTATATARLFHTGVPTREGFEWKRFKKGKMTII